MSMLYNITTHKLPVSKFSQFNQALPTYETESPQELGNPRRLTSRPLHTLELLRAQRACTFLHPVQHLGALFPSRQFFSV